MLFVRSVKCNASVLSLHVLILQKVHNCICLSQSFSANPESCHNVTDHRQATRQIPTTLTAKLPHQIQRNMTSPCFKNLFIIPALSNGSLYRQNYTELSNGMKNELERCARKQLPPFSTFQKPFTLQITVIRHYRVLGVPMKRMANLKALCLRETKSRRPQMEADTKIRDVTTNGCQFHARTIPSFLCSCLTLVLWGEATVVLLQELSLAYKKTTIRI